MFEDFECECIYVEVTNDLVPRIPAGSNIARKALCRMPRNTVAVAGIWPNHGRVRFSCAALSAHALTSSPSCGLQARA